MATAARLQRGGLFLLALLLAPLIAWAVAFHLSLAFALTVLLIGAAVFLTKPEWLLIAFVASQPWENALAYPTAQINIPKILGLALLGSWVLQVLGGRRSLRWSPVLSWTGLFFVLVLVSFMVSSDPGAGLIKTISYGLYALFAFLFVQLVLDAEDVRGVLRTYTLAAAAAAAYAVVGFLQGKGGRAGGPVSDPNDFAFVLAVAIPFAVYFVTHGRSRWLWIITVLVLSGGVLATFSRGAILGLLAVALWGLLTGRVPVGGVVAGFLALVVVGIAGYRLYEPLIHERLQEKEHIASTNVASRQAFWSAAARMAADRPLLGVGPSRFGIESETYLVNSPVDLKNPLVHNSYLEILAEDGALALAAWFAILGSSWRMLGRARRELIETGRADESHLCTALQASFICAVVSASFLSVQLRIPLWLVASLGAAVALEVQARERAREPIALPAAPAMA